VNTERSQRSFRIHIPHWSHTALLRPFSESVSYRSPTAGTAKRRRHNNDSNYILNQALDILTHLVSAETAATADSLIINNYYFPQTRPRVRARARARTGQRRFRPDPAGSPTPPPPSRPAAAARGRAAQPSPLPRSPSLSLTIAPHVSHTCTHPRVCVLKYC